MPPEPDDPFLSAFATFVTAHADLEASERDYDMNDADVVGVSERWDAAIETMMAAPPPTSTAGRAALSRAARLAFADQLSGVVPTREERLVLAALHSIEGAAA